MSATCRRLSSRQMAILNGFCFAQQYNKVKLTYFDFSSISYRRLNRHARSLMHTLYAYADTEETLINTVNLLSFSEKIDFIGKLELNGARACVCVCASSQHWVNTTNLLIAWLNGVIVDLCYTRRYVCGCLAFRYRIVETGLSCCLSTQLALRQ